MPTPKTPAPPVVSCHTLGACLGQRKAFCQGECRLDATTTASGQCDQTGWCPPGFAPGVIDGPYLRRASRTERLAHGLLLLFVVLAFVVALLQMAHAAGWF